MKKIFNIILGFFMCKKHVENVVCSHGFIKYTWSEEQKKYEGKKCYFCGKDLIND